MIPVKMNGTLNFPSISKTTPRKKIVETSGDKLFTVEHKIDGSNLQVVFDMSKQDPSIPTVASRHFIVPNDFGTFIFKDALSTAVQTQLVLDWMRENKVTKVNLFGELYGPSRHTRIDYGIDKNCIKFFALVLDNKNMCPKYFYDWANKLNIPIVEQTLMSLRDAIALDIEDPSRNMEWAKIPVIEGVVIKDYEWTTCPKVFSFKRIAPAFSETCQDKSLALKNRAHSTMSKLPHVQDPVELACEIISDMVNEKKMELDEKDDEMDDKDEKYENMAEDKDEKKDEKNETDKENNFRQDEDEDDRDITSLVPPIQSEAVHKCFSDNLHDLINGDDLKIRCPVCNDCDILVSYNRHSFEFEFEDADEGKDTFSCFKCHAAFIKNDFARTAVDFLRYHCNNILTKLNE